MDLELMKQQADYPEALASLVSRMKYRPGWRFALEMMDRGQGSYGLTFSIIGRYPDTYNPETTIRVHHAFIVPAAAFNEQSWRRWILDRLIDVETHEACEWFTIDGSRPYAPQHGPGNDPYVVFEHGSDVEARTDFRGNVQETGV